MKRIFNTAKNLKLPTWHRDFGNKELVLTALEDTMRHRNGNQYIPIPIGIGRCVIINNLKEDELINAMNTFEEL
jgi:3-dehydroquinate synthase